MLYTFYSILKSIDEVNSLLNTQFNLVSIKDRLIIYNYSNLITKVIKIIEKEEDFTKNTKKIIYFHDDGRIGAKLLSELIICSAELQPDKKYFKELIGLIKNESVILKNKISKLKNDENAYETPSEIQTRLDKYLSKNEVDEFIKEHKKLTLVFNEYDNKNDDNSDISKIEII